MKWLNCYRMKVVFVAVVVLGSIELAKAATDNQAPIADAGLSRYAAIDAVILDGTGSYDPDNSAPLFYAWQQIAGPSVVMTDPNTATPTISGFVQTDEIQECEFELLVSDGELTSLPDIVKVIIVPDFGTNSFQLENPPFDADKPTIIQFGGGDCRIGLAGDGVPLFTLDAWLSRANIIDFRNGYTPDSGGGARTYYKYGDMIIAYLSAVAPDYKQPIQTIGWSTGGDPAIDVGIHLNRVYKDARYSVNRVTQLDGGCRIMSGWGLYGQVVESFLNSSVDGEQCWVDHYYGTVGYAFEPFPHGDILWVRTGFDHSQIGYWYRNSLTGDDMNKFNNGVVFGAYWSVIGPGKNLQLAPTDTYYFSWDGSVYSGQMNLQDEAQYPGRLPEPVTLIGPVGVRDPNGFILTCQESENAVGYQLLFGSDPYRVMDYDIVTDTPIPPNTVITTLPFEETWWTVKVRDQYGSTIYADPVYIDAFIFSFPIENLTTGERYGFIQDAINYALNGDEIILSEGVYHEDIDFKGKNLTVRSTDPNDPAVVAATVINGSHQGSVITISGSQDAGCVLAGLTITGGTVGISCGDASVTIRNCIIESNGPNAIEFWYGYEPIIIDCTIMGQVEVNDPRLVSHWKLNETEGMIAQDSAGENNGFVFGGAIWQPDGGQVDGALQFDGIDDFITINFVLNPADGPFSVFAWIKDGAPGQATISQQADGADWLLADTSEGNLMTELKSLSQDATTLASQTVITDGNWHRVGFVWDGSYRTLYVDDVEVAADAEAQGDLEGSNRGLYIGAGKNLESGSFWSGLIDDVHIYNRAVAP